MIGSSTYIVKQNGSYCAHIGGSTFDFMIVELARKKRTTVFKVLSKSIEKWGAADVSNLTHTETEQIADATNNVIEGSKWYNKYAGDGCYLIDMDAKKVYHRRRKYKDEDACWKELTTDKE